MAPFIPFSKRELLAKEANKPLLYEYDEIPETLRVQAVLILKKGLGTQLQARQFGGVIVNTLAFDAWHWVFEEYCEEFGTFALVKDGDSPYHQVSGFLMTANRSEFLNALEFCLRAVQGIANHASDERSVAGIVYSADETIEKINFRFQENRIGYSFVPEASQIIRIDSQYLHAEAVEKAFVLLHRDGFGGAEQEFQEAHKKFGEGRFKDAIIDAQKAFESTIKTIGARRNWGFEGHENASRLIEMVFSKRLIPNHQQTFFDALKTILTSGLPTIRNRDAGHGQGETIVEMPPHVAAYALHLSAAAIVLLVDADAAIT